MFIVLVQNPKGGGLGATFGGMSANSLGGARNAGDFLERATWGLAIGLLAFSLLSAIVVPNDSDSNNNRNSQVEEKIIDYDPSNFNPNSGEE